jgi:hypothetical protein
MFMTGILLSTNVDEENEFNIVCSKKLVIKPMLIYEVILQINMIEPEF